MNKTRAAAMLLVTVTFWLAATVHYKQMNESHRIAVETHIVEVQILNALLKIEQITIAGRGL